MRLVTVEKARDSVLVTVHHVDGDQLAAWLDRAGAAALLADLEAALGRTVVDPRGVTREARGRPAELYRWRGEALTVAQWAARAGVTAHCMQARFRQHGPAEALRRSLAAPVGEAAP